MSEMGLQKIIFCMTGGLALFLYGMRHLSDGFQKLAGSRLRQIVKSFTSNHFKSLLVGAGVTSVVQSSSITTVMLVGLLNAGVMSLEQSIGVVFGANIGTTITAQIIAFKISRYALLLVAIGFVMNIIAQGSRIKNIGQVLLSLGFVFLGLKYMKDAFAPMKSSQAVMEFCSNLSHEPILAILCGVILTVIVQSSSASIGITIAMASTGLIGFPAALYLLLGDNIGTTVTAWLASIGSNLASKRMALVHTLFNITGACYFSILIGSGFYAGFIDWLTPGPITEESIARHIANAHTAFNIFNAIILFPTIGILAAISKKVFKGKDPIVSVEAKYLDNHLLDTPEIAIEQVSKELHHMGELSLETLEMACQSFVNKDKKLAEQALKTENAVDSLQQEITSYLVKIFGKSLNHDLSNKLPSLLHSVNDLEKVSDHAENIAQLTIKRFESDYQLSDEALRELNQLHDEVKNMFRQTLQLLETEDHQLGEKIMSAENKIDELKKINIGKHIERLKSKACHPLAGLAFVAYLNHIEKIGDHLTNVTQAALTSFQYQEKSEVVKI